MSNSSFLDHREHRSFPEQPDWLPIDEFGPSRRHLLPMFAALAGSAALTNAAKADAPGATAVSIGVPGGAAKLDNFGDLDEGTTSRAAGAHFSRPLATRFADRLNVKDLGAVGDGMMHQLSERYSTLAAAKAVYPSATTLTQSIDSCAIQRAIDLLAKAKNPGGEVYVPLGVYVCDPIILHDRVIITGDSITSTVFRLRDQANADLFTTSNFHALRNSNKFRTSEGVPGWIGLRKCRVDGNKSSQSISEHGVGNGLSSYARSLILDEVIIHDCFNAGIYSECGMAPTITDWYDLCEGNVGPVWIWNCNGLGWQMRGPHDQRISHLIVALCGAGGLSIESLANTYSGSCDIGFVHIYANHGCGIYCSGTQFRCQQLISESNFSEGVHLDSSACQLMSVQCYNNCRESGRFNVVLGPAASANMILNTQINQMASKSVGGIQVAGQRNRVFCTVDGSVLSGGTSGGIGIDLLGGAKFNVVEGAAQNFSSPGGSGLRVNSGGPGQFNMITAELSACAALFENAGMGNVNEYNLRGHFDSTQSPAQVAVSGLGIPNNSGKGGGTERFDIVFRDQAGIDYRSRTRQQHSSLIALNSLVEQTFTFEHYLIYAPTPQSCNLSIFYAGTDTSWSVAYMRIQAVTSTTVTATVKLATPASDLSQAATLCLAAEV